MKTVQVQIEYSIEVADDTNLDLMQAELAGNFMLENPEADEVGTTIQPYNHFGFGYPQVTKGGLLWA